MLAGCKVGAAESHGIGQESEAPSMPAAESPGNSLPAWDGGTAHSRRPLVRLSIPHRSSLSPRASLMQRPRSAFGKGMCKQ